MAFWICLTFLFVVTGFCCYSIIDQGVTITYMKEGFRNTENDLDNLSKIINETDFSKAQIKNAIGTQNNLGNEIFNQDTIELERISLIFKENKLVKVSKQP